MGDQFKVPPGSTVEVKIGRKKQRAPAPPAASGDARSTLPVDEDRLRNVRRGALGLRFYDLGSRLQSAGEASGDEAVVAPYSVPETEQGDFNEYLPLDLSTDDYTLTPSTNPGNLSFEEVRLTLSRQRELEARMLAGEPFGSSPARGSGRSLPHAMQWAWAAQVTAAGGALSPDDGPTFNFAGGRGDAADTDKFTWEPRAEKPGDELERWNPRNDRQLDYDSGGLRGRESFAYLSARARFRKLGGARFTRFSYSPDSRFFVPAFGAFRVTAEPDPAAEEVSFRFDSEIGIYLAPSIRAYYLEYLLLVDYYAETAFTDVFGSSWSEGDWWGSRYVRVAARVVDRLPVYPLCNSFSSVAGNGRYATRGLNFSVRKLLERHDPFAAQEEIEEAAILAARPDEHLTGVVHTPEVRTRGVWFAHHTRVDDGDYLLAYVAAKGSKRFYVWQPYVEQSPTAIAQWSGEMSLKDKGICPTYVQTGADWEPEPREPNNFGTGRYGPLSFGGNTVLGDPSLIPTGTLQFQEDFD